LQEYQPKPETQVPPAEAVENQLKVDATRRELTKLDLRLEAIPSDGGRTFELTLTPGAVGVADIEGTEIRCWPISFRSSRAVDGSGLLRGMPVGFPPVSESGLTSFVAFDVAAGSGEHRKADRFVLNVRLVGAPEGRLDRMLQTLLHDRPGFLRFLLLLLAREDLIDGSPGAPPPHLGKRGGGHPAGADLGDVPLFEVLLRTLSRSPDKLDAVDRLIADLRKTREGADLVPEEFERLWAALYAAREGGQP
jgi:hypothetical protein